MATTSTFSLRKLIQTRLHQDDEAIADDDTASSSHDDHNNPIKKRLTTWLAPGRRGSTSSTAVGRSSPSPLPESPLHPGGPTAQAQPESNREFALCGAKHIQPATFGQHQNGVSAKMADPKRRTLNDVPSSSSLGWDDASNNDQDYFGTGDGIGSHKKRLRPKTFLASPTPSSIFDPVSPPLGFNESKSATTPSDQDNMDTSLNNKSDQSLDRQSMKTDWSEGVRRLIEETDQAFEGVGSSIANQGSLDIPRLSLDTSYSNPDLTQMTPKPLIVDKSPEATNNVGPKAEFQLDVPPRRSSQRDAARKAEHRKSRSVPPPIQIRKASPPPGAGTASPRQIPPAPKSATHERSSSAHNKTPPLKSASIIRKAAEKHQHHTARRPSKSTRWAIPDNVSDLLIGRNVFKKQDVEEILTPEDLEKLKREREEKKRKESEPKPTPPPKDDPPPAKVEEKVEETIQEEPVEEKVESSPAKDDPPPTPHGRGLSLHSRFSHKSQASRGSILTHKSRPSCPTIVEPESPIYEVPSSSDDRTSEDTKATSAYEDDKPPVPRKNSGRRRPRAASTDEEEASGNEADDDSEPDGLATVDLLGDGPSPFTVPEEPKFPAPPPRNPNRLCPPTKSLPAIPKSAKRAKRREPAATSFKGEEDDEFYYLKSTPYSITAPCFKHGPITFAKSEIGRGAITMDDTLDWTAFQMAILGAGEFLPDMYDEGDGRYADEIKEWFRDFGFETHGVLIPETWPSSPRSSSQSSVSSAGSAENEHPVKDNSGYDTTKFYRGNGFSKRWTMEGKPKDGSLSAASAHKHNISTSDARSPLLIVDNEDGKISPAHQDEARMGFNLQGDLGDFLQWEAQHAYAGGYYGAH